MNSFQIIERMQIMKKVGLEVGDLGPWVCFDGIANIRKLFNEELILNPFQMGKNTDIVEVEGEHFQIIELLDAMEADKLVIIEIEFGDEGDWCGHPVNDGNSSSTTVQLRKLHFFQWLLLRAMLAQHRIILIDEVYN